MICQVPLLRQTTARTHILVAIVFGALSCDTQDSVFTEDGQAFKYIEDADSISNQPDYDEGRGEQEGEIADEGDSDPKPEISGSQDGTPATPDSNGEDPSNRGGGAVNRAHYATIEQSFFSSVVEETRLQFYLTQESDTQLIKMQSESSDKKLTYHQNKRLLNTNVFTQNTRRSAAEQFNQQDHQDSGNLDILVVIDNSKSMADEQEKVAAKILPLLSFISNSNWKIGIITTDPKDNCLREVISKGEKDINERFSVAIKAGIMGSAIEQGILQAVNGLKSECLGGSWLRNDSKLAVLIVSDEDNCSDGTGCGNEPYGSNDYLINYLNSIRMVGVDARVYGIVWHASQSRKLCPTGSVKAEHYSNLIAATNGSWGSICAKDYSNILASISEDLSIVLQSQFTLAHAPIQDSVVVYMDNVLMPSGYTISGNIVEFHDKPKPGSAIQIEYEYDTDLSRRDFLLGAEIDQESLKVFADNIEVPPSEFVYVPGSQLVRFNAVLDANEIKVTYFKKDDLLNRDFAVPGEIEPQSIAVTVNGALVSQDKYEYLLEHKQLHFVNAPASEAIIEIAYSTISMPVLKYQIMLENYSSKSLTVLDADSRTQLAFVIEDNSIVFAPEEFVEDRLVVLRDPYSDRDKFVFDLNHQIIVNSHLSVSGDMSGECLSEMVTVVDSKIDVIDCGFQSGELITFEFDAVVAHATTFNVDDQRILNNEGQSTQWEVKVNGIKTNAYSISGNSIVFSKLEYNSTIDVKVILYSE